MMTDQQLTPERCAELSAHDIANELNVNYSGDCSPIPHGGYFYSRRNWHDSGYADCVSIWHCPENDKIVVECGTINKPRNAEEFQDSLRCCGITHDPNTFEEIEAAEAYSGYEVAQDYSGDFRWVFPYDKDGTPEDQDAYHNEAIVWELALNHIRNL